MGEIGHLNGQVSHWMSRRPAVPRQSWGSLEDHYDLAIVGGGLTGLWTAYYAKAANPDAKIAILEAEHLGYGASGRNGGWLSTLVPGNRAVYTKKAGLAQVQNLQRALIESVDEVLRVLGQENIDAHQHKGGQLTVATTPAGLRRVVQARQADLHYGYRPQEVTVLDGPQTRAKVNVAGALGSRFVPLTSRIDPARMVAGLAGVLSAAGVMIAERTPVNTVRPGSLDLPAGRLRADSIAVCAEALTSRLIGHRAVIPVNSSVVITEPLPAEHWETIGWQGRECMDDAAHMFFYAQRTKDHRIAIGGRGSPYGFGSRPAGDGRVDRSTVAALSERLGQLFPGLDFPIAHSWRGSIGVTRDWCATVRFDPSSQIGVVFGYGGHGVTATNLAARTLVDRINRLDTRLTGLPWNDHRARAWEPEPIRWLGIHSMYRLLTAADRWEEKSRRPRTAIGAKIGSRLAGLHE
jgi:glycine/D-amino acid oxidase-like deaminating enzyme